MAITISDENDNAPVMDPTPLTGTETIVILEDAPVSSILAVVQATDSDVGTNADIEYYIVSGNDEGKSRRTSHHAASTVRSSVCVCIL